MLRTKCCVLQVLVLCLNYVNGLCPYAHQFNDASFRGINEIPNDISTLETVAETYLSSISYDTYQTNCHCYVSQPPSISSTIIEHALKNAVHETEKYTILDIEAAGGVIAARPLTDMDRINFFFEYATRYVQENTCSSKSTTTVYLPTLQLDKLQNYLNVNVTEIACDGGHITYPKCSSKSSHRQVDGTCNNLEKPLDGSVGDCMLRLLPPDYKDGINQLRVSMDGTPLPNPKVLSTHLFGGDKDRLLSKFFSQFQAFLGEFVISDNGLTLNPVTGMLANLQCCDSKDYPRVDHPQCASIFAPPPQEEEQSAPSHENLQCMQFVRSLPCARCNLGPRMLSSSVTAAQDLNSVYGVSDEMLRARRTFKGGCLQSQTVNGEEIFALEKNNGTGQYRCLEGKCELSAIDTRNILAPTGLVLALLFHRNHNRHARNIAALKPKWTDEEVFQTARRWNIAEYQHCVYNEYLETLIGATLMERFAIYPQPLGGFSYYKDDLSVKTIVEFQSTAGRHGHATLTEDIAFIEPKSRQYFELSSRDRGVNERIFYGGLVDGALLAQMHTPAFEVTPSIPFKTFVTTIPDIDLAAIDIQRQRDHGISGYIYYLKFFHDVEVHDWEDLLEFIDAVNIEKLKEHYKCVEDIELYVGGHYERKAHDAVVGPTFASIIGIQFHNAKFGDRFFYEHENQVGSFSIEQLNEIKSKTCFADILCKTTNLDEVLRDPLRVVSASNVFVSCSEYAEIDYKL